MTRPDPPVTRTRELADFLAEVTFDDRLVGLAEGYVLDTLACIVFGARQPWSRIAAAHALRTGGDGRSTVLGPGGGSTTPAMAAFANGAAGHAFELDDVHEEAISHPGAVVVPAALALAEDLGATGSAFLDAVAVGYEAMGRAGIAVGPSAHMLGGFHPTSMSGVFGSAAAAGRLLGFDGEQMNHAFGIAVSLASGTMEFSASGGMAKRIHAARAAEGGLTAALLAAEGFEGATDGLAGPYGFCNVFTSEPHLERLTEDLGERWMLDEITIKPWAACSDIHPLIQATRELRDEHALTAEMIERIEATGPTKAATQNSLDGTVSVMAAQYSGEWNIAAAILADPANPATYDVDKIAAPEVAALQAKVVSIDPAPEWDATYAWKMGGAVRITLTDGRVLERAVHGQKGSMHAPFGRADIEAKARTLLGDDADVLIGWARALRAGSLPPL